MFTANNQDSGTEASDIGMRPIDSITRAARGLIDYVSKQRRPNVQSGEKVVFDFYMGPGQGLDSVVEKTARLAVGKKLTYRNGDVEMHYIGDKLNAIVSVDRNLIYLMRHISGYLKLMDANDYFDVSKFDLSLYTTANSVQFAVSMYRV